MEHPSRSKFWDAAQIIAPDGGLDEFGGFSVDVDQCAWGHVARKRTRLYFVGVDLVAVLATIRTGGEPTHWCSGSRNPRRNKGAGGVAPPGIKFCSAQQRRRTPPLFARWLVKQAAMANRGV